MNRCVGIGQKLTGVDVDQETRLRTLARETFANQGRQTLGHLEQDIAEPSRIDADTDLDIGPPGPLACDPKKLDGDSHQHRASKSAIPISSRQLNGSP